VPSRFATDDEHIALAEVLADHPGTIIGFNPGASPFDSVRELMAEMSRRSGRVLNWNALLVDQDRAAAVEHELAVSDYASSRGGRVIAQTVLDPRKFYLSFLNGFLLDVLPDWPWLFGLPLDERRRALMDPAVRDRLRAGATSPEVPYVVQRYTRWTDLILVATFGSRRAWQGRTIGELAASEGRDPLDLLLDMAVDDNLGTVFMPTPLGDDDASWRLRAQVWQDHRTVIGASDAGAHLDVASSFDYSTSLLGNAVRERKLLSLEQAVYELTGAQRRVCGVRDRGRVAPGGWADHVVFDPDRVGPGPVETRDDLPGGARRLFAPALGIHEVLVNGVQVVRDGSLTGALPGAVLRPGSDTTEPDA
jgi:N-acyl-D-aspartate/D-glutamate deacylase